LLVLGGTGEVSSSCCSDCSTRQGFNSSLFPSLIGSFRSYKGTGLGKLYIIWWDSSLRLPDTRPCHRHETRTRCSNSGQQPGVLSALENDLGKIETKKLQISHKLLQYEVNPETFRSEGIRFATDYVIQELAMQKAKRKRSELGRATAEATGNIAGDLFQALATNALMYGGCFRTYALEPGCKEKAGWLRIPPRTQVRYVATSSGLTRPHDAEFLKCAPNFPVIDGLSQEGLFNYTRHDINANRYKEILTQLGATRDNPFHFYWVVKDGEGADFKKQVFYFSTRLVF